MSVEDEDWNIDQTEIDDGDGVSSSYQISYFPADFTLKGFLDKWDSKQLIVPGFQRKYVWDLKKASRLIESFLLGLPVPGVFLYKERGTNKLLVIDGQQRITSAVMFFKGLHEGRAFKLHDVAEKWNGKSFEDLPQSDQYQLHDTVLRATVVQQLDPDDDSSIYHIFERLNTGGVNLNPMEVRKCVYYGGYFEVLQSLNRLSAWRNIIGKRVEDKRLRDVELVLRVLAMADDWDAYAKPMKGFLNSHMATMKGLDEASPKLVSLGGKFSIVCESVNKELGPKPFHLRGRLNYALTDSILGALMGSSNPGGAKIKDAVKELLDDADYVNACSFNTSDEKQVYIRMLRAREALVG